MKTIEEIKGIITKLKQSLISFIQLNVKAKSEFHNNKKWQICF